MKVKTETLLRKLQVFKNVKKLVYGHYTKGGPACLSTDPVGTAVQMTEGGGRPGGLLLVQ